MSLQNSFWSIIIKNISCEDAIINKIVILNEEMAVKKIFFTSVR